MSPKHGFDDHVKSTSRKAEFKKILEDQEEQEAIDELTFLRAENTELRLVVAQLRSYISTLQKEKRRPCISHIDSQISTADGTKIPLSPVQTDSNHQSGHFLRNELLKMFSSSRKARATSSCA